MTTEAMYELIRARRASSGTTNDLDRQCEELRASSAEFQAFAEGGDY